MGAPPHGETRASPKANNKGSRWRNKKRRPEGLELAPAAGQCCLAASGRHPRQVATSRLINNLRESVCLRLIAPTAGGQL